MFNKIKYIGFYLDKYGIIRMSDKKFLETLYEKTFCKKLDLINPKTFNEKLQWLKLYDRKDQYSKMVDKYEVKEYVASIIGDEYIIPTLGIYEKFDDINFEELPNQFVIKCTHDSGGLAICKDKSTFDIERAKKIINKSLKNNYFYCGREWPYKNVKPRIIIEKYMSNNGEDLEDYKIHNFNGIPKIILVCKDRYKKSGLTEDFFDTNWKHLEIKREKHGNSAEKIDKPNKLYEMLNLSEKIAKEIPFVRTDFYTINNKVYFGEITFYPASGFGKFYDEKWDYELGDMISLPKKGSKNEK